LLDKTPLAERREQPMHARLGQAEGAGNRGYSAGLGRGVEVKEYVEGFLDRPRLFHAGPVVPLFGTVFLLSERAYAGEAPLRKGKAGP